MHPDSNFLLTLFNINLKKNMVPTTLESRENETAQAFRRKTKKLKLDIIMDAITDGMQELKVDLLEEKGKILQINNKAVLRGFRNPRMWLAEGLH